MLSVVVLQESSGYKGAEFADILEERRVFDEYLGMIFDYACFSQEKGIRKLKNGVFSICSTTFAGHLPTRWSLRSTLPPINIRYLCGY